MKVYSCFRLTALISPLGVALRPPMPFLNLAFDRVVLVLRLQLGVPDCLADHLVGCAFAVLRLSDDPLQGIVFVALIVGSYLWMKEHSDRANQPMLPVVRGDDCDALYFLLVIFYEPGMMFKRIDILPTMES